MKYKSETFEEFKEFRHEVQKQLGKSIKIFRLDRNGEILEPRISGLSEGQWDCHSGVIELCWTWFDP